MPTVVESERLLTMTAAARRTGLPLSAVKKLIRAGLLRTVSFPAELGIKAVVPASSCDEVIRNMTGGEVRSA